jgi:hypothetical protein
MSEGTIGQVDPARRVLVRSQLNVVGETHAESNARRDLEKKFIKEVINSDNYWTEGKFPDLPTKLGTRGVRDASAATGIADLMEYRAAFGAAFLIGSYETMATAAARVAPGLGQTKEEAVLAFISGPFLKFVKTRKRLEGTWEATSTKELDDAVKAAYDLVDRIIAAYPAKLRSVRPDQDKMLEATLTLGSSVKGMRTFVPSLEKAVGMQPSPDRSPADLAQAMRVARSAFMGLAGGFSSQKGVWKVGDGHITDLLTGAAKVDMSRANYVSKDDFNDLFEAWQLGLLGT